MNKIAVTPRLWFLPPVERLGSFRVGLGVALGLLAANLATALVVGGANPLEMYRGWVMRAIEGRIPGATDPHRKGSEESDPLGSGS